LVESLNKKASKKVIIAVAVSVSLLASGVILGVAKYGVALFLQIIICLSWFALYVILALLAYALFKKVQSNRKQ
jgi:uncharacterized Tic20 family protein